MLERFKNRPGHEKIANGEYELFNTLDTKQTLSEVDCEMLVPGMSITMAFVIGIYVQQALEECPRPGCRTQVFLKSPPGGQIW